MSTAKSLQAQVRRFQDKDRVKTLQGFFKTGKGQYGEGDKFLGVYNPQLRSIVKDQNESVPLPELERLLASDFNEDRALAVMFLAEYFKKARKDPARQEELYHFYCSHTGRINNWNLVDISCYWVVGEHLLHRPRDQLAAWAGSASLWERRIAMVSTLAFIRQGDHSTTLELATRLLADPEDLMHKAVGWMLREVGKRDQAVLTGFLSQHAHRMPRVMLRYAIERLPAEQRTRFLKATAPLEP